MDSKHIVKNVTFSLGLAFLLLGALTFHIQDWDVGVSLVMAFCTYCTADWVVEALRRSEYRKWPLALFFVWFAVDGSYTAYWMLVDESVMLRGAQWMPSLCMYLLCGVIWSALPTPREVHALWRSIVARFAPHQ